MIGLTAKISGDQVAMTIGRVAPEKRHEALDAIGMFLTTTARDNISARTGPDGAWPHSFFTDLPGGPKAWARIADSLQHEVVGDDGLIVGAADVAAGVRQLGTVGKGGELPDIVPVKKKALTIPISPAASLASARGDDARKAFPGAFVLKSQHGASPMSVGVLVRYVGGRTNKKTGVKENQKLEALYLLVKRVSIAPHRFLPFDRDGNIKPDSVWDGIVETITDAYVGTA